MQEPVHRSDVEGLAKAAYAPLHARLGDPAYHLRAWHDQERYRKVALGVRDALVPEGYSVVRTADLGRLVRIADQAEQLTFEDVDALTRVQAQLVEDL